MSPRTSQSNYLIFYSSSVFMGGLIYWAEHASSMFLSPAQAPCDIPHCSGQLHQEGWNHSHLEQVCLQRQWTSLPWSCHFHKPYQKELQINSPTVYNHPTNIRCLQYGGSLSNACSLAPGGPCCLHTTWDLQLHPSLSSYSPNLCHWLV